MKVLASIAGLTLLAVAGVASAAPSGDVVRGKKVFARCAACHAVTPGSNKIGPTMHGIVGRKAAGVAGFKYSPALKGKDIVWTRATLDDYLAGPAKYIPGTRMTLTIAKEQDRADLIAYLATLR